MLGTMLSAKTTKLSAKYLCNMEEEETIPATKVQYGLTWDRVCGADVVK